MKFYARKRRLPTVIIVSLIDIFAILLIFVIVTTTFKKTQPEVVLHLPTSKSATVAKEFKEPIVLSVSKDEKMFLDKNAVTLGDLKGKLQSLMAKRSGSPLAISADERVPYGFIVKVLDALKDAGVKGDVSAFMNQGK